MVFILAPLTCRQKVGAGGRRRPGQPLPTATPYFPALSSAFSLLVLPGFVLGDQRRTGVDPGLEGLAGLRVDQCLAPGAG